MSILLFLLSLNFGILDKMPVYENPIAYVRSPQSSINIFFSKEDFEKELTYLEGQIGKSIALITISPNKYMFFQLGLEASVWMSLGKVDDRFPLITQDFLMAAPIYFRIDDFSGAVKYNHISAHLGDGSKIFDKRWRPIVYSRDFISVDLAYDILIKGFLSKFYISCSYATTMYPDVKRFSAGGGFETTYNNALYFVPYFAYDLRYNQDMDSFDHAGQIGFKMSNDKRSIFDVRLALIGYYGSDRRGQLIGHDVEQFGVGLIVK